MLEPLLHLADLIGGDCPARARQALIAVFDDVEKQQRAIGIQLLRDIRNIFQRNDWPKSLPTATLVGELQSLPARPWDADGPITDRTLPKMLRPFEIYSRTVRLGEGKDSRTLRGYLQEQFVNVWHKLLEEPGAQENPSKNAECCTVSLAGKVSDSASDKPSSAREAQNTARSATVSLAGKVSDSADKSGSAREAQNTARSATVSPIGTSDGVQVQIDPRMKGILADHRNYFRQYPEQSKKNARDIAVLRHHWPQPADDTGPADLIYTLDDGIPIPYTKVNRDPRDPKPLGNIPNIHNKRERWPVLLSDDEKGQVAIARFHEIYAAARAHLEKKQAAAAADREQPSAAVS
jgi:hypothetical protein